MSTNRREEPERQSQADGQGSEPGSDSQVFSYWVPIDPVDLRTLAESLRSRDVFTPTFAAPEVDRYDPVVYRDQAARFETSTALLVDRNIVSRWIDMVRGAHPTADHRVAAAVLAFAQCAEIDVEPNIALYELAFTQGQDAAVDELLAFRLADHVDPEYWAEIALDRADAIGELPDGVLLRETDLTIDFTMKLRRWRRNYILALKIAELELRGGNSVDRMLEMVSWMYGDFLLGGPALALAAHYLAPNSPRKRLLKGLKSPDRERAIAGIRNAAWDLTLVSEWAIRVEKQPSEARLVLLASFDQGVHRLARSVVDVEGIPIEAGERLGANLVRLWGDEAGTRLTEAVSDCYTSLENPDRQVNRQPATDFIDTCIPDGEAGVRAWRPA